jgi:2-hydroxy-3-keto-5-methylthiopentenyl-1-phosphate phosphatase
MPESHIVEKIGIEKIKRYTANGEKQHHQKNIVRSSGVEIMFYVLVEKVSHKKSVSKITIFFHIYCFILNRILLLPTN